MPRAVLDTNVVVSGHIRSEGPSAKILLFALAKEFELYASSDIVAEYEEVLRRPKFKLDPVVVDAFLKAVAITDAFVKPVRRIQAALDPDDDKFLECAFEAEADYLVTGNLKDYPANPWWPQFPVGDPGEPMIEPRTRIVSPREFLTIIEG